MAKEKLDSALKTIGETSQVVGVPEYTLRFWEGKFKHIAPMKSRGRRYYDEKLVERLVELRDLLYKKGLTIKGAQIYFKEKRASIAGEEVESEGNKPSEKKELAASLYELRHELIDAMS